MVTSAQTSERSEHPEASESLSESQYNWEFPNCTWDLSDLKHPNPFLGVPVWLRVPKLSRDPGHPKPFWGPGAVVAPSPSGRVCGEPLTPPAPALRAQAAPPSPGPLTGSAPGGRGGEAAAAALSQRPARGGAGSRAGPGARRPRSCHRLRQSPEFSTDEKGQRGAARRSPGSGRAGGAAATAAGAAAPRAAAAAAGRARSGERGGVRVANGPARVAPPSGRTAGVRPSGVRIAVRRRVRGLRLGAPGRGGRGSPCPGGRSRAGASRRRRLGRGCRARGARGRRDPGRLNEALGAQRGRRGSGSGIGGGLRRESPPPGFYSRPDTY